MPDPATSRAKFRDLVAQLLLDGVPAVDGRVYRARVWPLKLPALPALLLYGYDEEKKRRNLDGGTAEYSTSCTMAVMGRVAGIARQPDAVEAELELLAGQIEAALLPPDRLAHKGDGIEFIDGVRTTMKVELAGEICNGEIMVALDLRWSDVYLAPEPDIECEESVLFMKPLPLLP